MTIRDHMISKKNAEARLVDQMKADGGPGSGPHASKMAGQASDVAFHASGTPLGKAAHEFAAKAHEHAMNVRRSEGDEGAAQMHQQRVNMHTSIANGPRGAGY